VKDICTIIISQFSIQNQRQVDGLSAGGTICSDGCSPAHN